MRFRPAALLFALALTGCSTVPLSADLVGAGVLGESAVAVTDPQTFPVSEQLFPNAACNQRVMQIWGEPVDSAVVGYKVPEVFDSEVLQQGLVFESAAAAAELLDGVQTVFMTGCDEVAEDALIAVYLANADGLPAGYDGFGWMTLSDGVDESVCPGDKLLVQTDYWLAVRGERAYLTRTRFQSCAAEGAQEAAAAAVVTLGQKAVAALPAG